MILPALLAVLLVRIVLTYGVFNDTIDEQGHLRDGLDLLATGRNEAEAQHPPLARIFLAALPYYRGGLRREGDTLWNGGPWTRRELPYYWYTLSLARAGNLVFAVLALVIAWLWAARLHGPRAGPVAGLLLVCCPNFLAHAGLATLDMAGAATVFAAAYCFWRWSLEPSWRWSVVSAIAFALAVLTKFSALVFLPPLAVAYFLLARPQFRLAPVALFAVLTTVLVWAGYGFDVGPIAPAGHRYLSAYPMGPESTLARRVSRILGTNTIPAPRLVQGLIDLASHNQTGHPAYLLGRHSQTGWWYYFPVALAVKTTLPLLLLAALALWRVARPKLLPPLLGALAVLAVSMPGNINIGVRHILPVYLFCAVLASGLVAAAPLARLAKVATVALIGWHVIESLRAHPDYLPYFNQIARGREERFLADSNLDWGQDLARLAHYVRDHNITSIQVKCSGFVDLPKLGIPARPFTGDPGWVAISANYLVGLGPHQEAVEWAHARTPRARIGRSIWIYYEPVIQSNRKP